MSRRALWKLETVGRERWGKIDKQNRSIRRVGKGTSSGCGWVGEGSEEASGRKGVWRTVIQRRRNGVGFTE